MIRITAIPRMARDFANHPVLDPPHQTKLVRDTVLRKVMRQGNALKSFPEFSNVREVALSAVRSDAEAIRYVHPELRNKDREIVLAALKQQGWTLGYISGHLLFPDTSLSRSDTQDSPLLRDKEVVMTAVKSCGLALQYAAEEIQDDYNVVLVAVLNNGDTIEYASVRLQNDKELVLTALATCKIIIRNVHPISFGTYEPQATCIPLRYASEKLCDDSETMLAAFQKVIASGSTECFEFSRISQRLRNDKDFVIQAVRIAGAMALDLASEELKKDAAVLNGVREYLQLTERIQSTKKLRMDNNHRIASSKQSNALRKFKCPLGNKQLVLKALKLSCGHEATADILTQMPNHLRADRDIFCLAAETGRGVLHHATMDLRDDEELLKKTLMFDEYHAIKCASERLQASKSIALTAMQINHQNISGISVTLLSDNYFLLGVAQQVRFFHLLRKLGGGRILGWGLSTSAIESEEWIEALVRVQNIYDEAIALGATFYILSQHIPLICSN